MGCVLGPTFANYYMGHLEEQIFGESDLPKTYCRYVDDIFLTVNTIEEIKNIKSKIENNSVLKATYELENEKFLNFLDISINNNNNNFETKTYIKPTNNGSCLNYNSLCPLRYKIGTIKTFLHRSYNVSQTWETFHQEILRIK